MVIGEPLMGSGDEMENGTGERETGSITAETEIARESRVRFPEYDVGRVMRAEPRMVVEEKSRNRVRAMWVAKGWEESVKE